MSHLVVVTGTATEIGKTHVSEALLVAWTASGLRTAGLKPVESGVHPGALTDAARLDRAATFHVKHFGVALPEPISPHLAARRAGVRLDLDALAAALHPVRSHVEVALVELPGGLFSPLTEALCNADLAARLAPDTMLLLAPDRLGVLHDVLATTRAAASERLPVDAVILIAPAHRDPSTGTNAAELAARLPMPVLTTLPRRAVPELVREGSLEPILNWMRPRLGVRARAG